MGLINAVKQGRYSTSHDFVKRDDLHHLYSSNKAIDLVDQSDLIDWMEEFEEEELDRLIR